MTTTKVTEKDLESGIGVIKAELDQIDVEIKRAQDEASELKGMVRQYNELKQRAADLKKKRKHVSQTLMTVSEFLQRITGHFPDGMFPLFNQEHQATEETGKEER